MTNSPLRAADVLALRLYQAGCRHAFGMPGGEVLTLVDALEKAGIRFTLVKHENAGGFIAEAVHHRDGAPAILVATVGPGAMNGVNVVANAEQDRVPMIVLSGCVDADEALTYTHQILDHRAVFRPITKATFELTAAGAGIIADKAVAIATEPRCGPVHIDVPISVADAQVPADTPRPLRVPASPAAASGADAARAREALATASRPIAVVGLDVLQDGSHTVLRAFLEQFGIPFVTTYKAKGVLPEDHPLCLGGAGLSPLADTHLLPLIAKADLVLCIGYDPIEMRTGWRNAFDPARQTVIDIAAVPNTHYMHQASLNFVGHTGETLEMLAQGTPVGATWPDDEPAAARKALAGAFPDTDEWGPAGVIAETRAVMPDDTLATADSGAHRILLSQMWRCTEPRGLIQSSALCTMGCAIPMAMGLKIAEPDRPVVSFSGDAGFLMVAGELATAAELRLTPVFLVFVDASLALIELKQRQRQLANKGVDFARHDFAAMGRAFGGAGHTVRTRAELRTALQEALRCDTFSVIAAEIEPGGYDGRI
ncbi:thiamine pyrophosphate-binding protein [Roseovarius atlanticus]|uniref:thiamine pyrophosphate-binding protein n=1 Tax=Roseovarius atlanticus TaxID=1641875 RepID=UPI001C9757F6|nr:thiamine pyrophosphate-binding protein [Roseovarius atlanticus]MBY5987318.1 thiamine pyrophosphate-binding protein [Roseovarius atlanticus]MBY6125958.1 thiamine pyrophosphate-binding protein [Roseovarius atlanticus]MBY6149582.1 thiamine pyrophosphate-binding protein [Roseovarius atlanticus]